jgi:uncharacterized protein YsxB (DUF464 family)
VIRVHIHQDGLDSEGGWVLYITGHANTQVCAGVSGIWIAMIAGLKIIAKKYPRQISLHESRVGKKKR